MLKLCKGLSPGKPLSIGGFNVSPSKNSLKLNIPLNGSIIPLKGMQAIPAFNRDTTATVVDHEGVIHTALINEIRFPGARRIYNRVYRSQTLSGWSSTTSVTDTGKTTQAPDGTYVPIFLLPKNSLRYKTLPVTVGTVYCNSIYIKANKVTTIGFRHPDGSILESGITLSTEWQRFVVTAIATQTDSTATFMIDNREASGFGTDDVEIAIWGAQQEVLTGSQTGPSEPISTMVLSWPYHGAGVDGVKYFLTDRSGNVLSTEGVLIEPSSTNLFLNSSAPATQNITVVSGSKYVIWGEGAGSVILSGAGTGTVTEGNPVTITAASTSLVCTVSNMTFVQVELNAKTSHIITTSSAVTRTADLLSYNVSDIITQGQGSLYCEFTYRGSISYPYILELTDGTTNNRISVYIDSIYYKAIVRIIINGLVELQVSTSNYYLTKDTLFKVMLTYEKDNVNFYINGELVNSSTSSNICDSLTYMYIGRRSITGSELNGTIKNVKYYKKVFNQDTAERMTS